MAYSIGIPFYVLNMEEVFKKEVVDYFRRSYLAGQTPNPCVKCNSEIKFKFLLRRAFELGATKVATGHYARIVKDRKGIYHLLRGIDRDKDQSYFLFNLTQQTMAHILFPLGGLTKPQVRAIAQQAGLKVSQKEDSQEICFVEEGDYRRLFAPAGTDHAGRIVDTKGRTLGHHRGLFGYTIGQRKGLGIKDGRGPYYVVALDTERNELVVGTKDELMSEGLEAEYVSWTVTAPSGAITAEVRIRYRHSPVAATIEPKGADRLLVRFSSPQRAVTPGQAVVFYKADEVLGGGWIKRAIKEI